MSRYLENWSLNLWQFVKLFLVVVTVLVLINVLLILGYGI